MSSETSGTPLVEIKDLSIAFGGIKRVEQASVSMSPGACLARSGNKATSTCTLLKDHSGSEHTPRGPHLITCE